MVEVRGDGDGEDEVGIFIFNNFFSLRSSLRFVSRYARAGYRM